MRQLTYISSINPAGDEGLLEIYLLGGARNKFLRSSVAIEPPDLAHFVRRSGIRIHSITGMKKVEQNSSTFFMAGVSGCVSGI